MKTRKRGMRRRKEGNIELVLVPGTGHDMVHATATFTSGQDPHAVFAELAAHVLEIEAQPVSQTVFGAGESYSAHMGSLESEFGGVGWPVTWIDGGTDLLATQLSAVRGPRVETLELDGHVVGTVFNDTNARHCSLGAVRSHDPRSSRSKQAHETFERLEAALELVGMGFMHVVRTWLYIDDILAWYDDFNSARWDFFADRAVLTEAMPASTGIGAANPWEAAVVGQCIATLPKTAGVGSVVVPSPLQCPASDYKSSFSRAAELQLGDERRLFVSGTASIAPEGETLHLGDVRGQIDLTMEVVAAILESRGMDWPDVTRGIAYFPTLADAPKWQAYCRDRGIEPLPVAVTQGVVCRDDLLFEIEVDAVLLSESNS
jgi:enamine deaminase RidA (YjgF/YER057c/UK114 family)